MQVGLTQKRALVFFFDCRDLFDFFAQVLASFLEPPQANRGEVLPPEQEHDYAAHHEAVPPVWR